MAHPQQVEFCTSVKNRFPERFSGCRVLDIGSLDINGNNRYLFSNYTYTGVDIGEGPNVDVVCVGHVFDSKQPFDIVITTECLEHDRHYPATFLNAIRLLKPSGLLIMTCATTGRAEHGTSRTSPGDSPFSHKLFNEYYKNLTEADIREAVNIEAEFSDYAFSVNDTTHDLYFWGIKKG